MKERDTLAVKVREKREAEGRLPPLLPISIRHREDNPPIRTILDILSPRSTPLKTSLLESGSKITSSTLTTVTERMLTEPGVITTIFKHPESTFIRETPILPPLIHHVSMKPDTIAPRPSMLESLSHAHQPVSIQSAVSTSVDDHSAREWYNDVTRCLGYFANMVLYQGAMSSICQI